MKVHLVLVNGEPFRAFSTDEKALDEIDRQKEQFPALRWEYIVMAIDP